MTSSFHPDSLHRLVKHAVDRGAAETFADAQSQLNRYSLTIDVVEAYAEDIAYQAAILTLCTIAPRVFLGGVFIRGGMETRVKTSFKKGELLSETVQALGAQIGNGDIDAPTIYVGPQGKRTDGFEARLVVDGWRGGYVPIDSDYAPAPSGALPLAGMVAASLVINAAYAFMSGERMCAHREHVGMSLWEPHSDVDWMKGYQAEPDLSFLPASAWLIGLGHLGQAYLWALGLLPYDAPDDVLIGLQDTDEVTESTFSTSILTPTDKVGEPKTRLMATWAKQIGFKTIICERLFDKLHKRQQHEPAVALCGVDNVAARKALENAGFDLIVEAGLGRGHLDFRGIRMHVFPQARSSNEIWSSTLKPQSHALLPAYDELVSDGILDQCGITLLADKAVGAPFVGVTAAGVAIGELLRRLHGGEPIAQIDLDLMALCERTVHIDRSGRAPTNPGFTSAETGDSVEK